MRNTWKVAKWEIKRNMKNKTFIIGLLSTPVIFIGFMLLSSLFNDSDNDEVNLTNVYVNDQINIYSDLKETVHQSGLEWELHATDLNEAEVSNELEDMENTAYLFINSSAINEGVISVYTTEDIDPVFMNQLHIFEPHIQSSQLEQLNLTEEEMTLLTRGVSFVKETVTEDGSVSTVGSGGIVMDRMVPGAFAGFIMLSVVFTGMAIFQSASQEKKDKIAEIILSSLTPADLMQGKIIGYFVLGIIQALVSIIIVLPYLIWRFDLPIVEYLFVPELGLLLAFAILGYLMFAAIFVGIGATMEDISTAGNFQGMVMMLPFSPAIFIGPILNDPSGLMAQIGTYIPFTSPGIVLLRLSLLEEWPWTEIIISLAILVVSTWFFMRIAGKIFKVGILLYGKNATPKEIWKWLRV